MGSGQRKNCWGKGKSSRCGEEEGCVCEGLGMGLHGS